MNRCVRCGQNFIPKRSDQMYCTKRCRMLEYKANRTSKNERPSVIQAARDLADAAGIDWNSIH